MRRILAPAAIAAVALSFTVPTIALAAPDDNNSFDLGVDVSGVSNTQQGVQQFLASLAPETRRLVIDGCRTYAARPAEATSPYTVPFCDIAATMPVTG